MPFSQNDHNNDLLINALWAINHLLEEGDKEIVVAFYEKNLMFVLSEIMIKHKEINKLVEIGTWVTSIFLKNLVKQISLEDECLKFADVIITFVTNHIEDLKLN